MARTRSSSARENPVSGVSRLPLERWAAMNRVGSSKSTPSLMPGVYALGLPDMVLAPGADSVVVQLGFTGARIRPIEISLVAYDPQDAQRLGMSALGPEGRIAALRGAFPRLTARELVEVRDADDTP